MHLLTKQLFSAFGKPHFQRNTKPVLGLLLGFLIGTAPVTLSGCMSLEGTARADVTYDDLLAGQNLHPRYEFNKVPDVTDPKSNCLDLLFAKQSDETQESFRARVQTVLVGVEHSSKLGPSSKIRFGCPQARIVSEPPRPSSTTRAYLTFSEYERLVRIRLGATYYLRDMSKRTQWLKGLPEHQQKAFEKLTRDLHKQRAGFGDLQATIDGESVQWPELILDELIFLTQRNDLVKAVAPVEAKPISPKKQPLAWLDTTSSDKTDIETFIKERPEFQKDPQMAQTVRDTLAKMDPSSRQLLYQVLPKELPAKLTYKAAKEAGELYDYSLQHLRAELNLNEEGTAQKQYYEAEMKYVFPNEEEFQDMNVAQKALVANGLMIYGTRVHLSAAADRPLWKTVTNMLLPTSMKEAEERVAQATKVLQDPSRRTIDNVIAATDLMVGIYDVEKAKLRNFMMSHPIKGGLNPLVHIQYRTYDLLAMNTQLCAMAVKLVASYIKASTARDVAEFKEAVDTGAEVFFQISMMAIPMLLGEMIQLMSSIPRAAAHYGRVARALEGKAQLAQTVQETMQAYEKEIAEFSAKTQGKIANTQQTLASSSSKELAEKLLSQDPNGLPQVTSAQRTSLDAYTKGLPGKEGVEGALNYFKEGYKKVGPAVEKFTKAQQEMVETNLKKIQEAPTPQQGKLLLEEARVATSDVSLSKRAYSFQRDFIQEQAKSAKARLETQYPELKGFTSKQAKSNKKKIWALRPTSPANPELQQMASARPGPQSTPRAQAATGGGGTPQEASPVRTGGPASGPEGTSSGPATELPGTKQGPAAPPELPTSPKEGSSTGSGMAKQPTLTPELQAIRDSLGPEAKAQFDLKVARMAQETGELTQAQAEGFYRNLRNVEAARGIEEKLKAEWLKDHPTPKPPYGNAVLQLPAEQQHAMRMRDHLVAQQKSNPIAGMEKIIEKVEAEISGLQKAADGHKEASKVRIQGHHANVDSAGSEAWRARQGKSVVEVSAEKNLPDGTPVQIDTIEHGGERWVEIKYKEAFGLGSEKWSDLYNQIKAFQKLAAQPENFVHGKPPRIAVCFTKEASAEVIKALQGMGVEVEVMVYPGLNP